MEDGNMSKILVIHHSDLDGIGVKIVGMKVAQLENKECETFKCNYNDVNEIIKNRISEGLEDVDAILIGDISVDEKTAELLDNVRKLHDIDLMLRDHHSTATWLNKYDWAFVAEKIDEVPYCGTYLLAREFPAVMKEMKVFIETVDAYDTWKWSETGNIFAKDLNSLFQVIGEQMFTEYILLEIYGHGNEITLPEQLFNYTFKLMIEVHDNFVERIVNRCEKDMYKTIVTVRFNTYKVGIVFCNNSISDVSERILSDHPEIDILMLISFPYSVSFRTKRHLEVPLGEIAKSFTGNGGGHPQAAGSVISEEQFEKILYGMFRTLQNPGEDSLFFGKLTAIKEEK